MEDLSKYKLVFAPGCFDTFDGTQEELDELVQSIKDMIADGTLMDHATPVDLDDPDLPEGFFDAIDEFSQNFDTPSEARKKKLN